jgi:uncharacterized protein YndB with AHSA1/START domain
MTMALLNQQLERAVLIRAGRETIFRYFTDSARWAAWWGAGSSIDARTGGRVHIRYPDGTEADGEVVEIASPERIVFTYGYASGKPIPPGCSRVTIVLEPHAEGTRVRLTHAFDDPAVRDQHVQGWRYQFSVFSNVVANELHANAAATVDAWFEAWATQDEPARVAALETIAADGVQFHDRYSAIDGLGELNAHIGGAQKFMPGFRLRRTGDVRHCQGVVLADWTAIGPDGATRGTGTNVFVFGSDTRLQSVVGLWN